MIALTKSRRRMAFPKAQLRDLPLQLQQGFAAGGMGFRGRLRTKRLGRHVRNGSIATERPCRKVENVENHRFSCAASHSGHRVVVQSVRV